MYRDDHDKPICSAEKLQRGRPPAPVPRPAGTPTPCYRCPKKNPLEAQGVERDLARALAAIELYYRVQGTAGACLSPEIASDPITVRNLGIVRKIIEEKQANNIAAGILPLLSMR
jgi:hypothetical protein